MGLIELTIYIREELIEEHDDTERAGTARPVRKEAAEQVRRAAAQVSCIDQCSSNNMSDPVATS